MINLELLENNVMLENNDKPSILFVHGMWHGAWCREPYFLPYFENVSR